MSFQRGDCVRVRTDGEICWPGQPQFRIGGWIGRVLDWKTTRRQAKPKLEIAWDSYSLRSIPCWLLAAAEEKGQASWSTIQLEPEACEPAEPRDTLPEAERARRETIHRASWKHIRERDVRGGIAPRTMARGEAYFRSGAVHGLRYEEGGFRAEVRGTEPYQVQVDGGPRDFETRCTCPYAQAGTCKHVAATLLAIVAEFQSPLNYETELDRLSIDDLMAGWPLERLQEFIRLQAAEWPPLKENLWIHGLGSSETAIGVERYQTWIAERLRVADRREVELEFIERARKFEARENWGEAVKIQEALYWVFEQQAAFLEDWSEALECFEGEAKLRPLERLALAFAAKTPPRSEPNWRQTLSRALGSKAEALRFLEALGAEGKRLAARDTYRVPGLLRALELAGLEEEFLSVGAGVARELPEVGLAAAKKFLASGRRDEARSSAEAALLESSHWDRDPKVREELQRLLLKLYDPEAQAEQKLERLRELLFEKGRLEDFQMLRAELKTAKEHDDLLQKVARLCPTRGAAEILASERRWDLLLELAWARIEDVRFPELVRPLMEPMPEAVFQLCRQRLEWLAETARDRDGYARVTETVMLMHELPGQESNFWRALEVLLERYSRRTALLEAFGAHARECQDRMARWRREQLRKLGRDGLAALGLLELAELCPLEDKDKARLVGTSVSWQRNSAALVWAALVKHGGALDAEAMLPLLAAVRQNDPAKARSVRTAGLKMLETLGWLEIEREKNRLQTIRLKTEHQPA